jgi:hypothetical protein
VERLLLEALTVGQHGLRYGVEHMHRMMDFVADGGVWSEGALLRHPGCPRPAALIQVSALPAVGGPMLLIHDGHHRLVATHLAGRDFLHPEEYLLTWWTWEEYRAPNFATGWVTPFDPRTQVRTADFATWKRHILETARRDPPLAERLIREQPEAYREPRRYSAIASLARDCCSLELDRWRSARERRGNQGP